MSQSSRIKSRYVCLIVQQTEKEMDSLMKSRPVMHFHMLFEFQSYFVLFLCTFVFNRDMCRVCFIFFFFFYLDKIFCLFLLKVPLLISQNYLCFDVIIWAGENILFICFVSLSILFLRFYAQFGDYMCYEHKVSSGFVFFLSCQ